MNKQELRELKAYEQGKKDGKKELIKEIEKLLKGDKDNYNNDNSKLVIRVNNGDVWKNGSSWFTFYCPECKRQLELKTDCSYCKSKINWI
jgi:hypothetical protein